MRAVVVAVFVLAGAASASAQGALSVRFEDGRVSIDAAGVPVRTILAEWERVGGTKVVGAERVGGAPLTVHLERVPESQALQVLLRNAAGYMAAPRRADAAGASAYDRILVLPTSSTQSASAAPPAARGGQPPVIMGGPRGVRGPFGNQPPAEEPPAVDESDTGVNEAPFAFPQQNPFQAVGQPGPFGTPVAPGVQTPVFQFGQPPEPSVTINPTPQQPMPVLQFPSMPPTSTVPTAGFGVIGSPTPGVIIQPPTPTQPGRPPGGR